MDRKELYRQKLEALFKEWKWKISMLEKRAERASSSMKSEIEKDIHELKQRRSVVQDKWCELQKASGDAWDSVRDRTEKAIADMKTSLDGSMSRRRTVNVARWFKPFSRTKNRSPHQRQ